MIKLLYTGKDTNTDDNIKKIEELGYSVLRHRDRHAPYTEDEFQCEVIVSADEVKDIPLENFKKLKFIQARMVGTDTVDIARLKERGIAYCNSRGVYDVPIAEFTLMRILDIYKRMRVYEEQTSSRTWVKQFDLPELAGKHAAVLGTGGIGVEIAKRLSAFDIFVEGFNRSGQSARYFDGIFNISEFETRIHAYDIIVIAVPLDSSTYHLFDDSMFDKMKKGAVLVNIGRGAIIEEGSLVKALESGKLLGAGIDVFEKEPLNSDSKLWDLKNLYYSPHTSFASTANAERMFNMIFDNLENYICGRSLKNRIV